MTHETPSIQASGFAALNDALAQVANRLKVAGLRERSIEGYISHVCRFSDWFSAARGRSASVSDLTTANVDEFLATLIRRGTAAGGPYSPSSIGHAVSQLRAVAGHLARAVGLERNPLAGLKTVRPSGTRDGDAVTDNEIRMVIHSLNAAPSLLQRITLAIILLGYECGPRTSELVAIETGEVISALVDGRKVGAFVSIEHPAKRGAKRLLPLGVRAEEFLDELVGHRTHGPLFVSARGAALSGHTVQERLALLSRRVGLEAPLTIQRLRRTAASWQAAYGASSGHLDSVFGWRPNPRDVKSGHYIKPTPAQLLHAHQTLLSPLDRLELRSGPLNLR